VTEVIPTRAALEECEAIIERGLQTFVEVGQALLRIRDERLYRETHDTFADYCQRRWGFSRQRGQQLVEAAETTTTVVTAGLPAPPNERVARELPRDPGQAAEVWAEAVQEHGGKATARQVREVRDERSGAKAVQPAPSWLVRVGHLGDELRRISRHPATDPRQVLALLAEATEDVQQVAAGDPAHEAPGTATTPRHLAAVEPAQEHNAGTQTTEATRDAGNGENGSAATETREETPQEDTSPTREMSDTADGMSDIDGREGRGREEGQNEGSAGAQTRERVAPESVPPPCGRAEHAGWEWHSVAGGVQCGRCHAPAAPELVAAWGSSWDRTARPFERGSV
jgi:hypothetical protein